MKKLKKVNLRGLYVGDSVVIGDDITAYVFKIKEDDDIFTLSYLCHNRETSDDNIKYNYRGICLDTDVLTITNIIPNPVMYSLEDIHNAAQVGKVRHGNTYQINHWLGTYIPKLRYTKDKS